MVFKVDSDSQIQKVQKPMEGSKQDEDAAMEEFSQKTHCIRQTLANFETHLSTCKMDGVLSTAQKVAIMNTKANGGRHDV